MHFEVLFRHFCRNESSEVLGRFCGDMENKVIQATGNQLFMVFVTDSSGNNAGFRATFTSLLIKSQGRRNYC